MSLSIVVVGAGVCGLSTAWHVLELADAPVEVTVLDMAHPGAGTSGLSVGMVETQFSSADAIETRAYGRGFYDRLCRDHDAAFTRSGYLRLGRTENDLAGFRRSVALQAEFGITDAQVLDPDRITAAWPDLVLGEDVVGGLLGRSDGYVDAFEVCSVLAARLRAQGVRILPSTRITDARRDSGRWRVTTTGPHLDADCVMNAAGRWAPEVAALLEAPVEISNQLYGVVAANLVRPPVRPLPFVMDYIPGSGIPGVYFRQEGHGQLIAGLHSEDGNFQEAAPSLRPRPLDEASVVLIAELLSGRVHGADEATVNATWTGVCAMTADGHPAVGLHPSRAGVVNAVGAGASGIQLAPAIGRQAAQAALGLPSSLRADHPWNSRTSGAGSISPSARSRTP